MVEYRDFMEVLINKLQDPEEALAHLRIALEEYESDGDSDALMHTLKIIAEAQGGVGKLAQKSKLNRQNLYKVFSGKTVPRFDTTLAIVKALGFKFSIDNRHKEYRASSN